MEKYFLMNKNRKIMSFVTEAKNDFSVEDPSFRTEQIYGQLPIGFPGITSWVEDRKSSKHNEHLRKIMKQLGCEKNIDFLRVTHAASVNDTFWIRNEKENVQWADVSLYKNEFTETVSRLAFEGVGLYGIRFSSTSPELACDGSFRKCFRKEDSVGQYGSDIFLYKRGQELGKGIEPYCEQMASEIAGIIAPRNAVRYDRVYLHGKLASKCNLFTDEKYGYASFSRLSESRDYNLPKIFGYFEKIGSENEFRELLVTDALCFNQDRHAGNYGVQFDNETLEIHKMAPVFDLNISLFPYVYDDEFGNIGDKLFDYVPKLGDDFTRIGQISMTDRLRDRVKDVADISFSFRGDDVFPEERVRNIEMIVQKQAKALLSREKLYTKDVYFSQKAEDMQKMVEKVSAANNLINEFDEKISVLSFGENTFCSICSSDETVQYFVEKENLTMQIDFLSGKIEYFENMHPVSAEKLRKADAGFWKDCELVEKTLRKFVQQKNGKTFRKYFQKEKDSSYER